MLLRACGWRVTVIPRSGVAMPHMIKHPAEILRKEFMIPLGLGATALAAALHVSERRVRSVLQAQGPISVDTAMRLARYFGTTPGFG